MCFNMLFTHKITLYVQHLQESYNLCNSVANVKSNSILENIIHKNDRETSSVIFCYFVKTPTDVKWCFEAKNTPLKNIMAYYLILENLVLILQKENARNLRV